MTWVSASLPGGAAGRDSWPIHRDVQGTPDGYVRYHVEEQWEHRQPRNTLHVDELHALDHEAYVDLWRFVTSMDWVTTVRAERRAPDERLPWLMTNARAARASDWVTACGWACWTCRAP